jgi:hypothetical protein
MTGEHRHDADPKGVHGHGGHEHLSHVPDAARPAVFAARAALVFDPPARPGRIEAAVTGFIAALSEGLVGAGCTLVGHIKGIVAADGDRGDLAFHATTLDAAPTLNGNLAGDVDGATLTINVIVFGVDEASLPAMVTGAWSRTSAAATTWHA